MDSNFMPGDLVEVSVQDIIDSRCIEDIFAMVLQRCNEKEEYFVQLLLLESSGDESKYYALVKESDIKRKITSLKSLQETLHLVHYRFFK